MSIKAIDWAMNADCKAVEKLILIIIADYCDENNICYPSMKTLSKKTGLAKRTVQSHIHSLELANLLEIKQRKRPDGSFSSNFYILNVARESGGCSAGDAPGGSAGNAPLEPLSLFNPIKEDTNVSKKKSSSLNSSPVYRKFKHLSITVDEVERIENDLKVRRRDIDDTLDSIENYAKNKNYSNLNLTLRKWLKLAIKRGEIEPIQEPPKQFDFGKPKILTLLEEMEANNNAE